MAGSTQKPKLGIVTVATVKRREQAREIGAKLEADGIKCFLHDERAAPAGAKKTRLGGFSVQVDRGDVARALQLLQQKDDSPLAGAQIEDLPRQWFRWRWHIDSRLITAIQIFVILVIAVVLAQVFFF